MATVTTEFVGEEQDRATEPAGLYEVIEGEVREVSHMGAFEADLAWRICFLLELSVRDRGLGRAVKEMLFLLNHEQRLQRRPDVAFVSAERWPLDRRAPRAAACDVVPDLAIEVASPSNLAIEDMVKIEDYFRAGVRVVWMIYPAVEKVYVYDSPRTVRILARGDSLDGGTLAPGFGLSLDDLFGEPIQG